MQNTILKNDQATCMLVEVIAKQSQNIPWSLSLDGEYITHNKIRRVSIDKLYELVTGNQIAFFQLCEALPLVLDDVIKDTNRGVIENSVFENIKAPSEDILKSLYKISFETYEGFQIKP